MSIKNLVTENDLQQILNTKSVDMALNKLNFSEQENLILDFIKSDYFKKSMLNENTNVHNMALNIIDDGPGIFYPNRKAFIGFSDKYYAVLGQMVLSYLIDNDEQMTMSMDKGNMKPATNVSEFPKGADSYWNTATVQDIKNWYNRINVIANNIGYSLVDYASNELKDYNNETIFNFFKNKFKINKLSESYIQPTHLYEDMKDLILAPPNMFKSDNTDVTVIAQNVDTEDKVLIDLIAKYSKLSSHKQYFEEFLKKIDIPSSKMQNIIDILFKESDVEKLERYFKNRDKPADAGKVLGVSFDSIPENRIIDFNDVFDKNETGINNTLMKDILDYTWSSSPAMGKGELALILLLRNGENPTKGDVQAGPYKIEVKSSKARLVGTGGFKSAGNMMSALKKVLFDFAKALNVQTNVINLKLGSSWTIGKVNAEYGKNRVTSNIYNIVQACNNTNFVKINNNIHTLTSAGRTKLAKLLSISYKSVYGGIKLALLQDAIFANIGDCSTAKKVLDVKGESSLDSFHKSVMVQVFKYYQSSDDFDYFVMINPKKAKLLKINAKTDDFKKMLDGGLIKYSAPSWTNGANNQGAGYQITLKT